ncbi:MAG: AAA family ATPase [Thiobacillus sp.]|nr:AAA family ATPase [Thiobacillus sp.]
MNAPPRQDETRVFGTGSVDTTLNSRQRFDKQIRPFYPPAQAFDPDLYDELRGLDFLPASVLDTSDLEGQQSPLDVVGDVLTPRMQANNPNDAAVIVTMPTGVRPWPTNGPFTTEGEWRKAVIDAALTSGEITPTEAAAMRSQVPRKRFTVLSADDLNALPSVAELIRGVLPASGIGAVYGASGDGKSFVATDMQDALSRGLPEWFGHRIPGAVPCVYIGLEGSTGAPKRFKALGNHEIRVILPGSFDLRNADDRAELVGAIRDADAAGGVLVIDTLQQACPGFDENSGRDMSDIIAALKELQQALGGLVLVIHHAGKDRQKGLRGHSSLLAALDVVLEVSRDGDRRTWRVSKSKDGADGIEHAFKLRLVAVGMDADGEPVTTCVIQPDAAPVKQNLPPNAGNQRIIFDALRELLRTEASAPEAAPKEVPPGHPAIEFEKAVEGTRGRLTCEPARQSERARLAFTGLIAKRLVIHRDGFLWLP